MGHELAEQRVGSYEDVKKCLDEWFAAKGEDFYFRGVHKLLEIREKCTISDGEYFERCTFYHFSEFKVFQKESAFHTCTPGMCVTSYTLRITCYSYDGS